MHVAPTCRFSIHANLISMDKISYTETQLMTSLYLFIGLWFQYSTQAVATCILFGEV